MQAAGNMGGFLSHLHVTILSFFSPQPTSTLLHWNQRSLNPICLFCLLGPQGQAVLHLVTPKAEKPGYLPLALEVTTPFPSVSAQLLLFLGISEQQKVVTGGRRATCVPV